MNPAFWYPSFRSHLLSCVSLSDSPREQSNRAFCPFYVLQIFFSRQGDLRKLTKIHFEGSEVGLLQDQLCRQEAFQVKTTFTKQDMNYPHVKGDTKKESACTCEPCWWSRQSCSNMEKGLWVLGFSEMICPPSPLIWSKVEDVLVEVGVVCEVVITTHAGHARFLFERIFWIWVSHFPARDLMPTLCAGRLWVVVRLAIMAGSSPSQVKRTDHITSLYLIL